MQLRMQRRSWPAEFLRPETPLFVIGVAVSVVILFVTAIVVWATFTTGLPGMGGALSLRNYQDVLLDPMTLDAGLNTLLVGIGTVIVSLLFAVPMAWLIHRTNVACKRIFLVLFFLHVLIPSYLKSMGWIMILSPKVGILNQFLRNFVGGDTGPLTIYNLESIAIIQGLTLTPIMFFMVSGAFQAIDPSFEEAAEVTGASRFQSIRRITIPLVAPAVAAAVLYTFMTAVSMFEVASLLGGPSQIQVFSTLVYSALNSVVGLPKYGVAGVYGVLLMVPCLIALHFYQRMLKVSHRYATVTGKGYRPKMVDLGKWRWAGTSFCFLFFALGMFIPFLGMAWTSVMPYIQVPSPAALSMITLNGYSQAWGMLTYGGVLENTAVVVLSVGVLVTAISITISWIVLRTRFRGRFAMDTVSMMPHAVPRVAIAFAVAFILLMLAKQIDLYGTVGALIIAYTLSWIAFGTRTINGTLIQVHNDLEDAVLTSGGSRMVAIRRVFVPLLAPTIAYVTVWTMLLAYSEVTAALFLQSPRNFVLSTAIWNRWQQMDTITAASMGVLMVLMAGAVLAVLLTAKPRLFLGRGGS